MSNLDFFVIGAQKAGTTWLYNRFLEVEGFCLPRVKEVHYFDQVSHHSPYADTSYFNNSLKVQVFKRPLRVLSKLKPIAFNLLQGNFWEAQYHWLWNFRQPSDDWYASYMKHHKLKGLTGDLTPRHAILAEEDVLRMHKVAPKAKLIYCLRDPIEQTWSHWRMSVKVNKLDISTAQNVEQLEAFIKPKPVLQHVKYLENSRKFEKVFQTKVEHFFYDDLKTDPKSYFKKILSFIEPHKSWDLSRVNFNAQNLKGQELEMTPEILDLLKDKLHDLMLEMSQEGSGYFTQWYQKYWSDTKEKSLSTGSSRKEAFK